MGEGRVPGSVVHYKELLMRQELDEGVSWKLIPGEFRKDLHPMRVSAARRRRSSPRRDRSRWSCGNTYALTAHFEREKQPIERPKVSIP